ncbi:MAG: PAS domain S-box protein [Vicinamibacterales bacterium]
MSAHDDAERTMPMRRSDYDPRIVPPLDEFSRVLLDTIDDIVYAVDLTGVPLSDDGTISGGRIVFVSNRVRQMLGYEPREFLDDPQYWMTVLHPDDRAEIDASTREMLAGRSPVRRSFRVRHKTVDDFVWFEDSVVPRFDAAGTLVGYVGTARDVTARKRLTQQMAVVLQNTRDGFFTLDSSDRCVYVNAAGAYLLNRAPDDIVGRLLSDLLMDPEESSLLRDLETARREHTVVRVSGYCRSVDRWLEKAIFPSPYGTMVVVRDVTAERTKEARLRTWVDNAPVGLFRNVPYGRMLDANNTALTMLGYPSLQALLEKNSLDLIVESADGDAQRMDLNALDRIAGLPITLRRMDGSHLPVLMNMQVMRDHSGAPVEIVGSFEDRTEPASLRSALLSSARRYRILFNENVTPMLVIALDGTVLSQNLAFLRLVRAEKSETASAGALTDYLLRPEHGAELLARTRATGRIEGIDLTLARADGSTCRVLASARLASESADTAFIEIAFVDIEERCRIEDELRHTVQEREFLMRELHHRVKNNLQLISSLLSLQAREAGEPSLQEFAQTTRDRIMAMAVVHERLYQTDTIGTSCIIDYLEVLVRNLSDSHDADTRGITLTVDGECVQMTPDQTLRVGLIVNELVMNALKHAFRGRGGTIRVRLTLDAADPTHVTITVADSGAGLPGRLDPIRTPTLGMQMVQNLARQTGGAARWSSNEGTEVSVDLRLSGTPFQPDPLI